MAIDLEKLEGADGESNHLLDLLTQMEDVLDSLDIYVYRHWFDGEVIEGPIVRRHWLSFSLLYPHDKMPDPRGALRLLKHDVIVEFSKVHRDGEKFHAMADEKSEPKDSEKKIEAKENDPEHTFWMVKINFPRRLISQMGADLDFYDDEVDVEDVEAAKDGGIDDESAYNTDEQEPGLAPGDQQDPNAPNSFETPEGGQNG